MNNNILPIYDTINTFDTERRDYTALKTSIDVRCAETGEIIFKDLHNKVIIPGSGLILRKIFDLPGTEITPTYNEKLGIETPTGTPTSTIGTGTSATSADHKALLFCCGIDGCGTENSQVYPVDYKKWIGIDDLLPFRYQLRNNDLSDAMRETYFGRKLINDEWYAYYFKRFDGDITLVQQYIDGTPIDSNIYDSAKTDSVESYVEFTLKITKDDFRDYFIATVGIDEAKVNSVSVCSAWPVEIDNHLYFNDIRPITKLNFPNESLIDITKGIDIIYHVYA